MKKIKYLVNKSIKTHTLFQDAFCYFFKKIKFASNYTAGLISLDKTYYKLKKKYQKFIDNYKISDTIKEKSKFVWIFWYQGLQDAPELVKKCINSVKENYSGWNIVIITKDNISEYIEIPDYIIDKVEKKIITLTHFSDILRAALLVKHGGLWLDATVLCTGNMIENFDKHDLFVYRNGWMDMENINMASWLIYSKTNNEILNLTLDLLKEYWKKHNYLVNYFLFHMFFKMATEKYNAQWSKIPYMTQTNNHLMALELNNNFNIERYNQIVKITDFHKLSYKVEINKNIKSFYYMIIKGEKNEIYKN